MDIKTILSLCDHTLLDRCATPQMLRETLDDAIKYGCATACIPSWFVKEAKGALWWFYLRRSRL